MLSRKPPTLPKSLQPSPRLWPGAARVQGWCRALCLLLFVVLLACTGVSAPACLQEGGTLAFIRTDIFLRLDPLLAVGLPLAARQWVLSLWPGWVVLAMALLAGRVFCRYICPMGTTLDMGRGLVAACIPSPDKARPVAQSGRYAKIRHTRYLLLAALLGAALVGVNLLFWASPIPLLTRLYVTLLHPLLSLLGYEGLSLAQPVFSTLDMPFLAYAQVQVRRFDGMLFIVLFFGLLLLLERRRPRFWCTYLCPAGGLLSLVYQTRRLLGHRLLPSGKNCPHAQPVPPQSRGISPILPSRRAFIMATGAGVGLAALHLSDLRSLLSTQERGQLWPVAGVRPPGAVPEAEFLDLCVRCGQCMKACPTNALQPLWLEAGMGGMFSPVVVARRGPCEPDCILCGAHCPTGALRPLSLPEKQQAKTGTAVIHASLCVAWSEGKRCLVCQEVCPYGAIRMIQPPLSSAAAQSMKQTANLAAGQSMPQGVEYSPLPSGGISPIPGTVSVSVSSPLPPAGPPVVPPVPVVIPQACIGCGYCENHCPARIPAITVVPLNALRLSSGAGSYAAAAQAAGLHIQRKSTRGENPWDVPPLAPGDLPPGFTD